MPIPELLDDIWCQQSLWSQTANRMKQRIEHARALALADTGVIAVLGTGATALAEPQPTVGRLLAAAAALGAAMLPLLRRYWSGEVLRDWTRARSVSEGLKREVYLWLAQAGDYREDPQGELLRSKTDQIREAAADLLRHQAGLTPAQRSVPAVHDISSYFAIRVTGQINDYYRPRATELHLKLGRFRAAEIALSIFAAAIGGAASFLGGTQLAVWIAVITTLSATLSVHVAATRYDYQLIEYLRTADRLQQLRAAAATRTAKNELNELAIAAEATISVENQAWMAELTQDPPDHKPIQAGP